VTADSPHTDILAEGRRVLASAAADGVQLRAAGGVAIALRCPSALVPPLKRSYADIDLAGRAKDRRKITALLQGLGYEADERFNAIHGATRLLFWDAANARQLDVFLDRFEMCHKLDLLPRLGIDGETLPLADLLLMKLQIVETNHKDMVDILALLVDQTFTEDDSGIDLSYIARLTSGDWGLWRTVTEGAKHVVAFASELGSFEHAAMVQERVRFFLQGLQQCPKSTAWKLRAKIGDRVRWYELPEEARRA
jgi:hypothetical protein